ncbi:MAG: T9SS type A sorting domain-containing protein [Calditrichaceae bacterium]
MRLFTKLFIIGFLFIVLCEAKENSNYNNFPLSKVTWKPSYSLINVNNLSGYVLNNGRMNYNPLRDFSGLTYPEGTGNAIYTDGIVWGGVVEGDSLHCRVGGQVYRSGTVPGWIDETGTPAALDDPRNRIYRIRSDWREMSELEIRRDAAEFYGLNANSVTEEMVNNILSQYEKDWNEWPVDLGAPYIDKNGNGLWDGPAVDQPGIIWADQVLFFVVNDFNPVLTDSLFGSPPLGLEVQITAWASQDILNLRDVYFKKYKIINKSEKKIDSIFVAQFSDPDIGNYEDDLVGYDESLQMMYGYNSVAVDHGYSIYGIAPPAIGYVLVQGPVVASVGDTAQYDFRTLHNHRNLDPSSFGYLESSEWEINYQDYGRTLEWYNFLNGYRINYGSEGTVLEPFVHLSGDEVGIPTKFPLNGDPVTGTGDIDGTGDNLDPGDRRMMMTTGPITMGSGDEQELVYMVAGGIGDDHLSSITQLRQNVKNAKMIYDDINYSSVPFVDVNVLQENGQIKVSWNSLHETYDDQNYLFLGYKVYQTDGSDSLILVGSFDRVDGITQVTDVVDGIETIVYSGTENGIFTEISLTTDAFTGDSFVARGNYYFAVQAILYNPDGPEGRKVLSNELYPVEIRIDPSDFTASQFILTQNFPNPFNNATKIQFQIPENMRVKIEVFNILGQKVQTLLNKQLVKGSHEVLFDGKAFSSGLYIYHISAGDFHKSQKMILIK